MSGDLEKLKNIIGSINVKLYDLNYASDYYQAEQMLSEIKNLIDKGSDLIDTMNSDDSLKGRLLNSVKSEEKDLKIYKKKYEEKVEEWEKKRLQQKLVSGELSGVDALKAQRQMGLDNLKEVDNQGLIVDSIAENIKGANVNLQNVNSKLDDQGQQMNRIQENTLETESEVKKTGKIMLGMEVRAKCIQIITFIAVIVFGLFDILWIIILCVKKFYWDKK